MAIRINANQTRCLFVMIFADKYSSFYFKHMVIFLSMNVLEEAFNKETALVEAFSEHCEFREVLLTALKSLLFQRPP